jgi:hypothetical protein
MSSFEQQVFSEYYKMWRTFYRMDIVVLVVVGLWFTFLTGLAIADLNERRWGWGLYFVAFALWNVRMLWQQWNELHKDRENMRRYKILKDIAQ